MAGMGTAWIKMRRLAGSPRARRPGRRVPAVVIATTVAAVVAGALVPASAARASSAAVQPGINYVALGDSYSSGEGNPPFENGTDGFTGVTANHDFCHRSPVAYPHILASTLQTAPLLFYACSGARTFNITTQPQQNGAEPPQITEPGVNPSANLITLTIGGDDAGFATVLGACVMQKLKADLGNALDPIGSWLGLDHQDPSCADSANFTSTVNQQILNLLGPAQGVFTALRKATDPVNTSIIAADYPLLFPTTQAEQNCIELAPFLTNADQNWLNLEGGVLDGTVIAAATFAGVNMIDVRDAAAGHAICGNGGAWANGGTIASGGGNSLIPLSGSFHLNAAGHAAYAAAFTQFINNATVLTPEGLPANPAPTGAAAKKPAAAAATPDSITKLEVAPAGAAFQGCQKTFRPGERVEVTGNGFAPSAAVTVYTSSPGQASMVQQAGAVTADSSGAIDAVVTIPLNATGFTAAGTSGGLIGLDAIGIGADGASHADALSYVSLASRRSLCGGATPLAGGELHSLVVNSDGTVSAMGLNTSGQLGNGTLASSATPVQVSGLSGVSEVSAGDLSSYALKSDGTVYAWGDNTFGQLGDGTVTSSTIPQQVSGLSNVEQIAAGNDHVLAVNADGTVEGWGLNNAGQLGDGNTLSSATPVTVQGLSNVVQVAAGGLPTTAGHSVALESDGTVWTWGYGKHGQLGLGSNSSNPVPTQVPGLTGIVQVAASGDNTYALKSDGTVYAWGDDGFAQIGNPGSANNQNTPLQVTIANATVIAAGSAHALAITADGNVWGWGDNNTFQLGDLGACGKTCVTPTQAFDLTGAAEIAAGEVHSLAETTNGTVYAWGDNSAGELGDGTTFAAPLPETVSGVTAEH